MNHSCILTMNVKEDEDYNYKPHHRAVHVAKNKKLVTRSIHQSLESCKDPPQCGPRMAILGWAPTVILELGDIFVASSFRPIFYLG